MLWLTPAPKSSNANGGPHERKGDLHSTGVRTRGSRGVARAPAHDWSHWRAYRRRGPPCGFCCQLAPRAGCHRRHRGRGKKRGVHPGRSLPARSRGLLRPHRRGLPRYGRAAAHRGRGEHVRPGHRRRYRLPGNAAHGHQMVPAAPAQARHLRCCGGKFRRGGPGQPQGHQAAHARGNSPRDRAHGA